jgi:hypothetical protein
MRSKLLVIAISALAVLGMSAALAATKHRAHHHRVAPARVVVPPPGYVPGAPRVAEPLYMYEARPGWWISSYDCVSDEGQGRWRPCSALGGGGGGRP